MLPDHAVLYDADCGFCKWSLGKFLAWDRRRRLRPVAIQSEEGDALLADMPEEQRLASWHLVTPDARVVSAGDAAPELIRLLPAGRPIAAVLAAFPRTTERAYRFVADRRTRIGRLLGVRATCSLPPRT